MRIVLLALALSLVGCHKAPAPPQRPRSYIRLTHVHPFPEAAEVRLFVATGMKNNGDLIFKSKTGRVLTPEQRRQFESLLFVQTPVNLPPDSDYYAVTGCFDPHHFLRYYDASGRQIGQIAVCFCCDGTSMSPSQLRLREDQHFEADYPKLQALIGSWGEPNDIECRPAGTVRPPVG